VHGVVFDVFCFGLRRSSERLADQAPVYPPLIAEA
jgi:hypothetical protein